MEQTHLEIKRQIFHLILGLVLAALVYYDIFTWQIIAAVTLVGALISLIVQKKKDIEIFDYFKKHFARDGEYLGRAPLLFFLGVLLVVAFFPKNIAVASILILGVGDSISHLIGRFYGKIKTPLSEKKMLEGFFAGWITGALAAWYFVGLGFAIAAAGIAMLVEFSDINPVDDNIMVPVVSGVVLFVLTII